MFAKLLQGVPLVHQQQLLVLPPEARAAYLNQIRVALAKQKQNQQHQDVKMAPIQETQTVPQKRTRGSGPRKCNNPSCDKIVTKRNFCYKCQKRKERGLPLGPRLPSLKQLLLPSDEPTPTCAVNTAPPTLSGIESQGPNQPVFSQLVQLHQQSQSYPELLSHFNPNPNPNPQLMQLHQQSQSQPLPKSISDNFISETYQNYYNNHPQTSPFPVSNLIKSESSPEKLAQLHQYLVGLAGSEESAADLVRDYLTQIPVKTESKNFIQQQQQTNVPGNHAPLRFI